jgi:hypothetical protein
MAGGITREQLDLLILLSGVVFGGFTIYRLIAWVRAAPLSPDPWDSEVATSLEELDAGPLCHRCFAPQPANQWFCEHCGSAVGDYNNWMPYVYLFSEGEVLRNGVTAKFRANALTIVGYLLYSLCTFAVVFAPVYWFFLFRNLGRIKKEARQTLASETG